MYSIRPFETTDEDYKLMETIWNTGHQDDQYTAEIFKHDDNTRNAENYHKRYMISANGAVVAYGSIGQNETAKKAKKFRINVAVLPEHDDQQGVRGYFHDFALEHLKDKELVAVASGAREDYDVDLAFLKSRGFESKQRAPRSHLDVQNFDFSQWDAKVKAVEDSGIEFLSARDLQEQHPDNWQRLLYELEIPVVADMPRVDEFVPMPFETYVKSLFADPMYIPEANFLAREGDQLVGISSLWKDVNGTDKLWVGLTGVLRSHRRRGIATALKVVATRFAKEYGAKIIEADNEENNPMYQINMVLGFKPAPAYLYFEKSLE